MVLKSSVLFYVKFVISHLFFVWCYCSWDGGDLATTLPAHFCRPAGRGCFRHVIFSQHIRCLGPFPNLTKDLPGIWNREAGIGKALASLGKWFQHIGKSFPKLWKSRLDIRRSSGQLFSQDMTPANHCKMLENLFPILGNYCLNLGNHSQNHGWPGVTLENLPVIPGKLRLTLGNGSTFADAA